MLPRCIVEVRWGRRGGMKAVIEAGKRLRVGGNDRADVVIPHDAKLSGAHFELRWDGWRCVVRDLGSVTGTRLAGAEVKKEAVVPHGGWIQAGETDFMVYTEGKTPPREEPEPEEPFAEEERREREERRAGADRALGELRDEAAREPLYAVVDAARDSRILELLRESAELHRSLYEGAPGEPLDEVAPYLVGPMAPESRLLERLVLEGWGRRWGIWCTSRERFAEVRRQWRRFLMVELEDTGERVYFRFYDPGVLSVFLPVCHERQLDALFGGGMLSMIWTDKDGARRFRGRSAPAGDLASAHDSP